jgi:putative ABC transport system ATP-binding protein
MPRPGTTSRGRIATAMCNRGGVTTRAGANAVTSEAGALTSRRGGVAVVARGVGHRYRQRADDITVFDGFDLTVPAGGYLAITGPSGVGKSTLLALLGGLERPQVGSVVVGDVDLAQIGRRELADHRRATVGFVFQHFGLLDHLTALENVEVASTLDGRPRRGRRRRAAALLDAVGVGHRAEHRPLQLSGGERQRVAIARALANDPRLLLADEPTGNLDEVSGLGVIELLEAVRHERGCTLVIVTHHRGLAARAPLHLDLAGSRR